MKISFAESSVSQVGEHNGPQIITFGVSSPRFSRQHSLVCQFQPESGAEFRAQLSRPGSWRFRFGWRYCVGSFSPIERSG